MLGSKFAEIVVSIIFGQSMAFSEIFGFRLFLGLWLPYFMQKYFKQTRINANESQKKIGEMCVPILLIFEVGLLKL